MAEEKLKLTDLRPKKEKLKPTWVFDHPDYMNASIDSLLKEGQWHAIARTRTMCGLKIQPDWCKNIPFKGWKGPAMYRRCSKCQARWKEKYGTQKSQTT